MQFKESISDRYIIILENTKELITLVFQAQILLYQRINSCFKSHIPTENVNNTTKTPQFF